MIEIENELINAHRSLERASKLMDKRLKKTLDMKDIIDQLYILVISYKDNIK